MTRERNQRTSAKATAPSTERVRAPAVASVDARVDAHSDRAPASRTLAPAPSALAVTVWGARGSLPASGPRFERYGGATCAVEVDAGGHTIVLDAGTGIVAMGADLKARGVREVDLFLSHLHYDHVMGLPFFAPAHDPATAIRIHYGGADTPEGVREAIGGFFREPFFPAPLGCMGAAISFHPLREGEMTLVGDAAVTPRSLNHPGGAQGFRIERLDRSFAYVTDFEHDGGAGDEAVLALAREADLALVDATYAPDEYAGCRGWGHAHWRAASDLAARADARSFGLFHHRHDRTDDQLVAIERELQAEYPNGFAACEGQRLVLPIRALSAASSASEPAARERSGH